MAPCLCNLPDWRWKCCGPGLLASPTRWPRVQASGVNAGQGHPNPISQVGTREVTSALCWNCQARVVACAASVAHWKKRGGTRWRAKRSCGDVDVAACRDAASRPCDGVVRARRSGGAWQASPQDHQIGCRARSVRCACRR